MGQYRLYCLNDAGRFSKSHDIPASNDEEALALAKAMKLPFKCELWDKARMVAKLEPHSA